MASGKILAGGWFGANAIRQTRRQSRGLKISRLRRHGDRLTKSCVVLRRGPLYQSGVNDPLTERPLMPPRPPRPAAACTWPGRRWRRCSPSAVLARPSASSILRHRAPPRPRRAQEPAPGEEDLFAMPAIAEQTRAAFGLPQAGDLAGAAAIFDRLIELHPGLGLLRADRATLAMLQGDAREALAGLEAAVADGFTGMAPLAADPLFAPLAGDPRFAALAAARRRRRSRPPARPGRRRHRRGQRRQHRLGPRRRAARGAFRLRRDSETAAPAVRLKPLERRLRHAREPARSRARRRATTAISTTTGTAAIPRSTSPPILS